jgi:hypothetical protein
MASVGDRWRGTRAGASNATAPPAMADEAERVRARG